MIFQLEKVRLGKNWLGKVWLGNSKISKIEYFLYSSYICVLSPENLLYILGSSRLYFGYKYSFMRRIRSEQEIITPPKAKRGSVIMLLPQFIFKALITCLRFVFRTAVVVKN